jgi:protein O-GlcNAc transferase
VLEGALKLQPTNIQLRMDLTAALVLSGRSDAASAQLAETLRRDPAKAPWIHENYGAVFLQNRRDHDLEVLLQAAVAAQPGSARLHYEYGVVLGRLGREQVATQHLLESLRLEPENPSILTALGLLAQRFQRPAEARAYLERALRADPGNAVVRDFLQRLEATSPPPFLQR